MTASTTEKVEYQPYDEDTVANPYPIYKRLRDEAPLYRNEELDFYAVSRFDDVSAVLQDFGTYSSAKGGILEVIQADLEFPPGLLIFEDPPTHPIHRRLLSRLFTPKLIGDLEPRIRKFCVDTLDGLAGVKEFDIMENVGSIVPMRAIGMLLGIPEADQDAVREKVDASLRTEPGQQMNVEEQLVMGDDLGMFVDWRIENPADDVITRLLQTEFEDETGTRRTLTRQEVVTYTTVLAGAGNETTGRLISWFTKLLAENPDQRRLLVEDPSRIPNAIEEVLRMEPPGPFICRYVTRDVEWHGKTVPQGSVMMAIAAAGNRDERRYEAPEEFRVLRPDIEHLTFGGGIHFCLGNALARLEGRIVLEEMLKRFPEWDVDLSRATLSPTSTVRGWETLPVILP
jgi:cytochrome P450